MSTDRDLSDLSDLSDLPDVPDLSDQVSPSSPLAGVRIVEFGAPGPVAHGARILALLGADVVRVVRPGARTLSAADRGRPFVELDLKDPEALALARDLVERADVLIEGFRPDVMDRIGLGATACCTSNPRLVYVRVSGWGREGSLAQAAGHDLNYVATSGLLEVMTPAGAGGYVPPPILADLAGGAQQIVIAVLTGLVKRALSSGGVVDVALIDGAVALTSPYWARSERPADQQALVRPFYRTYLTADGARIAVACIEDKFYENFLQGLGLSAEEVPDRRDSARWPRLTALFADIIARRTGAEWNEVFRELDACVSPVLKPEAAQEYLRAAGRDLLPRSADGRTEPRLPLRFDETEPPAVGQAVSEAVDPQVLLSSWCRKDDPS